MHQQIASQCLSKTFSCFKYFLEKLEWYSNFNGQKIFTRNCLGPQYFLPEFKLADGHLKNYRI